MRAAPARLLLLAAVLTSLLTLAVVVFVVENAPMNDRGASAVVHGLIVALPAAVALMALARNADDRFARALLLIALLWSATALAESTDPTLYSLGRVAGWLVEPAWSSSCSPSRPGAWSRPPPGGRTAGAGGGDPPLRPDGARRRRLPRAGALVGDVRADGPANALQVTASQPAIVDGLIRPLREAWLTVVVCSRSRWSSSGARGARVRCCVARALVPVAITAVYRAVALRRYTTVARAWTPEPRPRCAGLDLHLSLPLVALSFGLGLVLRQTYAAAALQRLASELGPGTPPSSPRGHEPRPWRTRRCGSCTAAPKATRGRVDGRRRRRRRCVAPGMRRHRGARRGRHGATLLHDEALAQDPFVTQAAASYALVVLENGRLVERLRVVAARPRQLARAARDRDRRRDPSRIERDLHDGAQQRLIGLRIRLRSRASASSGRPPAAAVAALGAEVEDALDELRALAHGIYPAC